MTVIVPFPQERCRRAFGDYRAEPAIVLILPVVRIERDMTMEFLTGPRAGRRIRGSFDELKAAIVANHRALVDPPDGTTS